MQAVAFSLYKKAASLFLNKGLQRRFLASQKGFEPPTPRLGGVCSIQLSYWDLYKRPAKDLYYTKENTVL